MKTKVSRTISGKFSLGVLAVSSLILIGGTLLPSIQQTVNADAYQDQINSLQSANNTNQASINDLQSKAASYQDAINNLATQINSLQASIDDSKAQQATLQQQITDAQNEIDKERGILGNDVKSMYVDGTPTTLEVLATSKNLSEFVDKQQYRSSVQKSLQATLKKIADLQKQLQDKKTKVEQLLKEQQDQQAQLASTQAQQTGLLAYNQDQQASYNSQVQANVAKINSLRAAQAAANRRLNSGGGVIAGDPGHGGYPAKWENAAQDSVLDNWGMFNRECVSYTAWKVYQTYGSMPNWGGRGNANQWPGNARADGIATGSTPKAASVAIWNVGSFGHAMWVESVNSDGSIWVSQFNYDYTGHYSEMKVSASMASSLTYIYFK